MNEIILTKSQVALIIIAIWLGIGYIWQARSYALALRYAPRIQMVSRPVIALIRIVEAIIWPVSMIGWKLTLRRARGY